MRGMAMMPGIAMPRVIFLPARGSLAKLKAHFKEVRRAFEGNG